MEKPRQNHFSSKMMEKSSEELKFIASNRDYARDAQMAAQWELERRESFGDINKKAPPPVYGEGLYKEVIASLWDHLGKNIESQEIQKSVEFDISGEKARELVMKAADKLGWKSSYDGKEVIYIGRVDEQGNRKQSYLVGFGSQQMLMAYITGSGNRKERKEAYLWILLLLHVFDELTTEAAL